MTGSPRVSIVMPVFDAGRPLAEALGSATGQTRRDIEVVVVDDGSTDPVTRAVLERAVADRRVTVHRTSNRGPAHARNRAIEEARGAYVLPLDADDRLAPTFLERTVPLLDAEPALGVVHTWVQLFGRHHGIWKTGPFTIPALLTRCTVHVSSLYRRELWADVGGYDPAFAHTFEDWDFWLSAASRGWEGRCVAETLAAYRRLRSGREVRARAAGVKGDLIRRLVSKHRALYERHLEDAMAGLFERLEWAGATLERFYHLPPVRLAVAARALWWRVHERP